MGRPQLLMLAHLRSTKRNLAFWVGSHVGLRC